LRIELVDGTILPLNRENPYENTTLSFRRMSKSLPAGEEKKERRREARLMPLQEIIVGIATPPDVPKYRAKDKLDTLWRDYYRLINEVVMRFSLPLACIAFVMIGMPLAVVVRPGAKSVAFILTFSLMFLYYILLSWGRELGERGNPVGWGLIFLPNILLAAIGLWLMKRAIRR
jgi:lipopolysaccharide export LptBFGC system permease protein LptF